MGLARDEKEPGWWGRPERLTAPRLHVEALERRELPGVVVSPIGAVAAVQELIGAGVTVSNVVFTGDPSALGLFTNGAGVVGFERGIILSSGMATIAQGPNTSNGAGTGFGLPGDPDLTNQAGAPTFDAAILEFDFVTAGNRLTFQYVFGSEEYNEFVGSFNDVFAFFLNGQNVALLPNGQVVSVNNVNLGANAQFYRNNELPNATIDTELDGLTTVLTVEVPVTPGVRNHIKLAIADANDDILDSAVFIASGSFASPGVFRGRIFYPFRYIYDPTTDTYRGNLTIANTAAEPAFGPLHLLFNRLPDGVALLNASGQTSQGKPFLTVPGQNLAPGATVRVAVVLSNSQLAYLSTFFEGYPILVVQGSPPT
jgi:hypothetical protein